MSFLPDLFVSKPSARGLVVPVTPAVRENFVSAYTVDRRVVGRVGWIAITFIA